MQLNKIPRIEFFPETTFTGTRLTMSYANNRTPELWKSFMPRLKEIENRVGGDLFSVEDYNDPNFMQSFNPTAEFEKWAAVKVRSQNDVPVGMESLVIPEGKYAVFHYKGRPGDARPGFQYIYGEWLPNSEYQFDNRPYFALMGEKYLGDDPKSEEEFWFPVREKQIV